LLMIDGWKKCPFFKWNISGKHVYRDFFLKWWSPTTLKYDMDFFPRPDEGTLSEEPHMKYTRFEKARIIGARALQISMGAPVLVEIPEALIDPLAISIKEYEEDAIPITVRRDYD